MVIPGGTAFAAGSARHLAFHVLTASCFLLGAERVWPNSASALPLSFLTFLVLCIYCLVIY